MKKVLREFGLRTGSWFWALRLASAFHFFPLPLSDILPRANHATRHPQGMTRHPPPAVMAIVAGLRGEKLPDHIALTIARREHRTNSGNLGSRNSDYV